MATYISMFVRMVCQKKYGSRKLKTAFEKLYQKAQEMNGLVSGEHGIGYAKKQYLKESLGENQIKIMQQIKNVFDPKNILNPGKICQ